MGARATASIVESLEPRQLLAANVPAFAFLVGAATAAAVATDAAGNVYVAGDFEGTVDFNPSRRRTFNLTSAATGGDPFVAKYSPSGGLFWAVRFGNRPGSPGDRDTFVGGLAVDAGGNAFVVGQFEGAMDFDPSDAVSNLTSGGNAGGDGFLLALDADGAFRYAKAFPTPGTRPAEDVFYGSATHVALDADGHVYVARAIHDVPDGGLDVSDVAVSKLTAKGRTLWSREFGNGGGQVTASAMTVDGAGNAYLAGHQQGGVDFDPGAGTRTLPSNAKYLLKLSGSGELGYAAAFADGAAAHGLATDAAGNLYAAGTYSGTADFNFSSKKTFALTSQGGQDGFVAKYSPVGGVAWAKALGGGGTDGASGVVVAADGLVYATGRFEGTARFNPGVSKFKLTSADAADSFFATYDAAGVFQGASQIAPRTTHLAAPATGGLVATGVLLQPGDVDPRDSVLTLDPVVDGLANLFVLKLT
jgi:hypothetical protein